MKDMKDIYADSGNQVKEIKEIKEIKQENIKYVVWYRINSITKLGDSFFIERRYR